MCWLAMLVPKLRECIRDIDRLGGRIYVEDEDIRMKYTIIDCKILTEDDLDLSKSEPSSGTKNDIYKSSQPKVSSRQNFDQLFKERTQVQNKDIDGFEAYQQIKDDLYKPKGYQHGHQSEDITEDEELKRQIITSMMSRENQDDKEVKKMKIDLQISSNLRVSVALKDSDDPRYVIGNPMNAPFLTEHHVISFERYINMPPKMRMKKMRELKRGVKDKNAVESVNPWLISDIDYTFEMWKKSNQ
ncbi:unnamed protein product [Moneuplotes crassus]|uniref:Uncharacterized protein n=1 Tax=Euplotes crassus TaxID=5936 RepID=A0AAD1UPF4_EUPCR|nr:unnamed protein product [Moneuplotes crassus]